MIKGYKRKWAIERIVLILIGLIMGFEIGWIVNGCLHEQIEGGSLAEWFGGIGTTGTLCFSLWSTLRTKPKVEVGLFLKQGGSSFEKLNPSHLFVTFEAFNQSNLPVKLQFYGFRRKRKGIFFRPDYPDYSKRKEIKPNDSMKCTFNVRELSKIIKIKNNKQKIQVGFAEPNGELYTKTFKRSDLVLSNNTLNNLQNIE